MADDVRNPLMRVGGTVQAIVPQSFEEAWRVAGALAASGLVPKDLATQEKVLVVIMAGAEIGMPPFQALQSFAVINGRPALWGDGMLATVRKFGVKVEETIVGDGDTAVAHCTVTRSDTGEQITREFSVADAKAASLWKKAGPWTTYPKRMLQMRARAWALRDGCADMLRGMKMAEEVEDYTVERSEAIEDDGFTDSGRTIEKVVNPETGRLVDPYSANQLRKPGGKWETMIDKMEEFKAVSDLDGLTAWFTSDEISEDLAKWPRSWRETMEQEYTRYHDAMTKNGD